MQNRFDGDKEADTLVDQLSKKIASKGKSLKLTIFYPGSRPCQRDFSERKKVVAKRLGVEVDIICLDPILKTDDIVSHIQEKQDETDGILVQLPMEAHVDRNRVLNAIPCEKDVEGFSARRMGELFQHCPKIYSPVTKAAEFAIQKALKSLELELKTLDVVIVGNSYMLGKPLTQRLSNQCKSITILDIQTTNLKDYTIGADIIISGTGTANLIAEDMVKEGVIIIDAGFEPAEDGTVAGDIHPEVYHKASFYTPVPGGIGPLTIAFIFDNLLSLTSEKPT